MAKQPLLSIVITSYTLERLKDIFELLDSIKAQGYPSIETIFVAERSTELFERVKDYAEEKDIANMMVVFNDGKPSLARARNLGIEHAKGQIIAFIDDDALAFPDWAEEMVKTYLAYPEAVGVTGVALPAWENKKMQWLPQEFYWLISCTAWFDDPESHKIRVTRNCWGMNMSFLREAIGDLRFTFADWAAHGGNKLGLEADDTEISLAISLKTGRPMLYNPEVKVLHKVFPYRLSSWFVRQKAFCQGYSKATLSRRYPELDMAMESTLLKRILFRCLPQVLLEFPRHPMTSWRRLSLGVYALFSLALGYFSGKFPNLSRPIVRLYWK